MLAAEHINRHGRAMLFARILIASLPVTLNSLAQSACYPAGDLNRNLSRLMARYHALSQFHGTVLVAHGDDIVFEQGFGEANREWGNHNGIDTKFRLGSVTKSITATLALNLVDEGLVDLSDTVSRHLPDFRRDVGDKVTVHHLLTHSSGIALPAMSMDEYWDFFQRRLSTNDILEQLCSGDLRFEPGDKFQYSSAGYMVLGAVIERVTGQPYAEALQKRVFLPAGMIGTGVDDPELIVPFRATGYQTNWGLGTARYKYMPSSFSSGSLYSTVEDIYRWNRAIDSGMLFGPETRHSMFKRHLAIDEDFCGYGWFLGDREVGDSTVRVAYHGGDVSGFSAFVLRSVDAGDLVVLLSNQEGLKYETIALNILRVLHGYPAQEPKEYVADLIRHAILSGGLDHGLEAYAEIRDRGLDMYNTDEDELIELGYDLLAVDRTADAVGVFQIAVDLHRDSPSAYDSLAEAQLTAGDLEGAGASCTKVLELEPGHRAAAERLAEILALKQSAHR